MNRTIIQQVIAKSLVKEITFPQILATLNQEGVESYHVDFLRNEYRYYAGDGDTYVTPVALSHAGGLEPRRWP